MDENTVNTETVDQETEQNAPAKLTFDELLKDPEYQAEFDRKVAKSTEKAKAKWQKEAEKERSEAEALAKMSEEEKHQHELNKIDSERKQAVAELNAYKLKDEAQKIASEKGIDVSLLDLIDYTTASAENVREKIGLIETAFNKAVEKAVNEKLRQPTPQAVRTSSVSSDREYLNNKYKNNPFYKQN